MSKTIPLIHPVASGTETITSVTMRRPKVRDIQAMEVAKETATHAADLAATVAIVAALSGLPIAVVEDMDAEDFKTLSETASDFL